MSRWLCCCADGTGNDGVARGQINTVESDYLLPGSSRWDASSRSTVTSSKGVWGSLRRDKDKAANKKKSTVTHSEVGLDSPSGDYEPPRIPPSQKLPSFEEFRLLKTVGRGAFGKVLLSVHKPTRILYAMKVVPKAKITTQKQVNQILAESRILKNIRHPFCVALQYAFQNDDYLFYVFEFAAGGMLFHHLRQEGKFSEHRARFYFGEIILALDYLHSFGIVFRDLKPENCMLSERGHIVLTDFGSAKMLEMSEKTTTIAGTPQYIAPEVLRGEPYSFSADWWSCGILLYEMLVGKTPFYSSDRVELYKLVLRGDFNVPKSVSPRGRALLYRLINRDPEIRIGCACGECQAHSGADIKQHMFFSKAPLDPDEEAQYAAEETERGRHRDQFERSKRSSKTTAFVEAAGNMIRTLSVSTRERFSNPKIQYAGEPCQWTWEELERREVAPSFKPNLASPTDLRHFDPSLTSIPPTIADLVGTERSLHIEGFDYIAPITENDSNTKLDSTIVESHRSVAQGRTVGENPDNYTNNSSSVNDESHEQHRPISKQVHNGKMTAGHTMEVTVEINES